MSPKFGFKLLTGAVLAASSAAALAAQAWSVDLQNGAATVTGNNYTTVRTYVTGSGADTLTLSASAYSNTGTNTGGSTVDNSNNNLLESAYLYRGSGWQGLGVYNRDKDNGTDSQEGSDPEHSIDNNERTDAVLMDFGGKGIRLDTVDIGWAAYDSDFFVLAYQGAGTPVLSGTSYKSLSGWTLIGNYSNQGAKVVDLATAGSGSVINADRANIYSSFWLIGAGGFEVGTGVVFDTTKSCWSCSTVKSYDYLKLAGVGGTVKNGGDTPGQVPEPGSLALLGLAALGLVGSRKFKPAA